MDDLHEHGISYLPENDPAILVAAERARATFKYFWREASWEARRIVPALMVSAVKATFATDARGPVPYPRPPGVLVEHMWLHDVSFDGQTVEGELINEPRHLEGITAGERYALPLAHLTDWLYATHGQVCGAFTVHVTRARLEEAERREYDEAWGLPFGPPESPLLVPDWAAPKPRRWTRWLRKSAPEPPTAPSPDAEHPMSRNVEGAIRNQLAQAPQVVHEVDEEGWTQLHAFALAGSATCVRAFLDAGADPSARTPDGRTARDLAEALGWDAVVALLPPS